MGNATVGAQVEAIRAAFAADDDLRDYAQQITLRPGDPWRVEGEVTSLAARRKAVRIARRTVRDADIEDGVRLEPRMRRSDDRLAATLREALAGEPAFQDVRIVAPGERPPHLGEPWLGILVHDGDVFLGGRLDLARKSLAEALAWETGSCCDVHNLVSHDPPRHGIQARSFLARPQRAQRAESRRYLPMTDDSIMTAPPDDPRWLEGESPRSLVARRDLGRDRKIAILRQWELDLRERLVAEEENMLASEPMTITLDQVLDALAELGATPERHPVPTTHG